MAKTKWQFYLWQPKDFWSDYRLNGLSGKSIAFLRALHDLLWMELDKCLPDDAMISKRLRISIEDWEEARREIISAGLLISKDRVLTSPHISEYWEECRKIAATRKETMERINEERKIAKPRLVKSDT
jgi:DNA-directed RNA polymerase specialized sigma subunit